MAKDKQFDTNGAISLWKRVRKSDGQEFLSGTVELDGRMYNIILNYAESDNPKAPVLRGRMTEDNR